MTNVFKNIQKQLKKDKSLLFWDIETSPMLLWGFSLGENHIGHEQIEKESKVITIQWMFEGDKHVSYLTWDENQDDKTMLKDFSKVLDTAKIAISQNGREFDHKVLRWRMNVHQLPPLKNVQILDTYQLSKSAFKPACHKLDYKSKVYGVGGKIPMKMQDWINVVKKVPGALEKMIKYGCKDVPDLRTMFWRELPHYPRLPVSLARLVFPADKVKDIREFCPKCAVKRTRKFDIVPTTIYNKAMFKCINCSHTWVDNRRI